MSENSRIYLFKIGSAASTVACIFSPTIEFLNTCRFIQGLGAAGGIVLSRSISTDSFAGRDLAKALVIIRAVNGVAPVSAPVILDAAKSAIVLLIK